MDSRYRSTASASRSQSGHERSQSISLSLANQFQGKAIKTESDSTHKATEDKFSLLSLNLGAW